MAEVRAAYDTYFHGPNYLRYLVHAAVDIQRGAAAPERLLLACSNLVVQLTKLRRGLVRRLRPAAA